jgi:hypothetical protein
MRTGVAVASLVLCCACSAETERPSREMPNEAPPCVAGMTQGCSCAGAATGAQSCSSSGWSACSCPDPMDDFENPMPPVAIADAGDVEPPPERADCSPGLYFGTYECEITLFGLLPVPLAGDVSFNLSINEMVVPGECEPSDEFCSDLVISENGGTLYGLAGLIGFETQLQGALDCTTGEFRAMGLGGRYGNAISSDPNDPDALWTVEEPPLGMFSGELSGKHAKASAGETIAGDWNLREEAMDITCAGPFTVTLQP